MVTGPPFGFEQCLGSFTMLLVEGCSETVLFRHFFTTFFGVPNFGNTLAVTVTFFFENVQNLI